MGTRSSITMKTHDGKFRIINCNFDGYLSYNGKLLLENYDTYEKVEALIQLGDLSTLNKSIDKPEGHSYNSQVDGYSVFYGRDRGETGTEFKEYHDYPSALKLNSQEYDYLYEGGNWFVRCYITRGQIELLSEMMIKESEQDINGE